MADEDTNTVHLNQIVAVEKGARTRTETEITGVYHLIQRGDSFMGISRVYTPKDDEGDQLPPEEKIVAAKTQSAIDQFKAAQIEFGDVIATKDWGNTEAKADVVVDGITLIPDVPVTHLLFMEKRLLEIKAFIGELPVLPTTDNWTWDEQLGQFRSDPAGTVRTTKIPDVQVLYEATDKHPAQVQPFNRDVVVGTWTTTKFSSALPASRVTELLDRVTKVQEAVKFAREEANMAEVPQRHVTGAVLDYIFA